VEVSVYDRFYQLADGSFTVPAKAKSITGIAGLYAKAPAIYPFNGDEAAIVPDTSTGISSVATDTEANGNVYNLNGQRISKPKTGVYIMNNRKYVAK